MLGACWQPLQARLQRRRRRSPCSPSLPRPAPPQHRPAVQQQLLANQLADELRAVGAHPHALRTQQRLAGTCRGVGDGRQKEARQQGAAPKQTGALQPQGLPTAAHLSEGNRDGILAHVPHELLDEAVDELVRGAEHEDVGVPAGAAGRGQRWPRMREDMQRPPQTRPALP